MTGFLPGHCISYKISFLQLEWCLSCGSTMKINSNLDQPSKKYAGFLISHIQLLSALLMILSVGSICGVKPAAEHPWLLLRLILPRTAESRVLQQYSSADFFLISNFILFFFQKGLIWPLIFLYKQLIDGAVSWLCVFYSTWQMSAQVKLATEVV